MQPSTQKFAPSAYNYLQPTTPLLPRLGDDEFCRAQSSSLFCMMFWAAKQQSKEVEGSCGRACYSCHLTWCGGRGVFSTSVTTAASWSFCKTWERSSAAVRSGARNGESVPGEHRRSAMGTRNPSNIHVPPESHCQAPPFRGHH